MPLATRTRLSAPFAAALVLFTACAGVPAPERGIVDGESLNEDEGIVFGILEPKVYDSQSNQLRGSAVPEIEYELYFGIAENLGVKRTFSGFHNSITGSTRRAQTFFAMKLPAGEYSFFKLHRPFPGTIGAVPADVRFSVAPNTATYIGSLQIEFRATRGMLGYERVGENVTFKVVDDAANATRTYKERNPGAAPAVVIGLMKPRRP